VLHHQGPVYVLHVLVPKASGDDAGSDVVVATLSNNGKDGGCQMLLALLVLLGSDGAQTMIGHHLLEPVLGMEGQCDLALTQITAPRPRLDLSGRG
jgi:hypothetical protein